MTTHSGSPGSGTVCTCRYGNPDFSQAVGERLDCPVHRDLANTKPSPPTGSETRDGFRLLGKHRRGCWGHEAGGFAAYEGAEWRTRDGRNRQPMLSGRQWYRFACNDPDCPAKAVVRLDKLAEFVNRGVSK